MTILRVAATKAMTETQFDTKRARDYLVEMAKADAKLRSELIFAGADQVIRSYVTAGRRCGSESAMTEEVRQHRINAKTERRLFWDRYCLFGHTPLRNAKIIDLRHSIDNRRAQAAGNLRHAAFEEEIMKAMPSGVKTVGDVFTVEKLMQLAKRHKVL